MEEGKTPRVNSRVWVQGMSAQTYQWLEPGKNQEGNFCLWHVV